MAQRKEVSLSIHTFLILVILALGLAAFYRFPGLDRRPMHTDEAILATKLGQFWNSGHFQYDPKDYHGPALHQVSWLWGHIAQWGTIDSWTDAQVRIVVAVCGLLLLVATLLFADALGRIGTALALLFMAASPMMVFYSRYFIMEMQLVLLVALTLGAFWRYSQGGTRLWLLLGGCAIGFQHATKETFIINVGAAVCGWIAARVVAGEFAPRKTNSLRFGSASKKGRPGHPWLWVAIPAVLISVASFSSGFRDWHAVQDSVTTYGNYLHRSAGSGHEKPWYYYLVLIFGHRDKVLWTEGLLGGLGLIGMGYAFFGSHKTTARQAFLVFLSIYTLAQFTVYSLLSYKTPWCILSAQYSLTLLAGVGGGAIWKTLSNRILRWSLNILLFLGIYNFCDQSSMITGTHPKPSLELSSSAENPYAYAHPPMKLLKLVAEVKHIAAQQGDLFSAQVISPDQGWPLPWYWRNLPRIGYQATLPKDVQASVVVVDTESIDDKLLASKRFLQKELFALRPGVFLALYTRDPYEPAPTLSQPPAPFSSTLPPLPAPMPMPLPEAIPMPDPGTMPEPEPGSEPAPALTPPPGVETPVPMPPPAVPAPPPDAAPTPAQPAPPRAVPVPESESETEPEAPAKPGTDL